MSEAATRIEVEVVFAQAATQPVLRLAVPKGSTAAEAVAQAGLMEAWRGSESEPRPLARFGRLITPETVLAAGDRVEILRPLLADPKDQRRQRVRDKRKASARVRSAANKS